jgi:hypothetical protein
MLERKEGAFSKFLFEPIKQNIGFERGSGGHITVSARCNLFVIGTILSLGIPPSFRAESRPYHSIKSVPIPLDDVASSQHHHPLEGGQPFRMQIHGSRRQGPLRWPAGTILVPSQRPSRGP